MKQKYKNLNIELKYKNNSSIIEHEVNIGKADFGFISSICNKKEIIQKEVYSENIVLVGSENISSNIEIKQLINESVFNISTDEDILKNIKCKYNCLKDIKAKYNLENIEALKLCVIKGYGVAFLPYYTIKKEVERGDLKIVNIKENKDISIQTIENSVNENNKNHILPVQNIKIIKKKNGKEELDKIYYDIEKNFREHLL